MERKAYPLINKKKRLPLDSLEGIPAKAPKRIWTSSVQKVLFFFPIKRECFVNFRKIFVEVGWQRAAAGCVEGGLPCSHEQTDSDTTGIDAKGIIQRFRNPEYNQRKDYCLTL